MTKHKFNITEEDLRLRADLIIARELPELSRSYIKKLAVDGKLTFKGTQVHAGYKLRSEGELVLDYDMTALLEIPDLELPIIFEDDSIVVINKPSGIITHARGKYWDEASVASAIRKKVIRAQAEAPAELAPEPVDTTGYSPAELAAHKNELRKVAQAKAESQAFRAGIVHRLDRATSGVIICAKTEQSAVNLQAQFSERTVAKEYIAYIEPGKDIPDKGLIDKPIGRNPKHPSTFKIDANGKEAQTDFEVTERTEQYIAIKLMPKTGRTHQLRIHLASINTPIIGDYLYEGMTNKRLLLHAAKLTIKHPLTNKSVTFEAPLPSDFTIGK